MISIKLFPKILGWLGKGVFLVVALCPLSQKNTFADYCRATSFAALGGFSRARSMCSYLLLVQYLVAQ